MSFSGPGTHPEYLVLVHHHVPVSSQGFAFDGPWDVLCFDFIRSLSLMRTVQRLSSGCLDSPQIHPWTRNFPELARGQKVLPSRPFFPRLVQVSSWMTSVAHQGRIDVLSSCVSSLHFLHFWNASLFTKGFARLWWVSGFSCSGRACNEARLAETPTRGLASHVSLLIPRLPLPPALQNERSKLR